MDDLIEGYDKLIADYDDLIDNCNRSVWIMICSPFVGFIIAAVIAVVTGG